MGDTRRLRAFLSFLIATMSVATMLVGSPALADAPRKAAVFPFELVKEREDPLDIYAPAATEAETKRLGLMNDKLAELLKASGIFSRIDLSKYSDKIEKASPIQDCNGCELDIAKQAGAEVTILGIVRKASNALINISIYIRKVENGELIKVGAVSIREDNDAGWLRAVRWIMKNRILKRPEQ